MELDGVTFLTRQDDVKTKSSTLRFSAPKELFKELINIENEYTVNDYDIFKITIVVKFPIGVFEQNVSLIDVVVLRNFGHMKTFRNVKLSPDDINKLILLAKDYIPETSKYSSNQEDRMFIKEDTYTCPYCGLIVEREKLPNPPEFKMAIISRNDIECPNCGNYGMNYMTSGLGSRMFGYTLADLCRK